MDEDKSLNPYEAPRHASQFYTLQDLARLAWIKVCLALWGCGLLIFFVV